MISWRKGVMGYPKIFVAQNPSPHFPMASPWGTGNCRMIMGDTPQPCFCSFFQLLLWVAMQKGIKDGRKQAVIGQLSFWVLWFRACDVEILR